MSDYNISSYYSYAEAAHQIKHLPQNQLIAIFSNKIENTHFTKKIAYLLISNQ